MKIPRDWLKVCFSFAKLCPYSFKRITTSSRDYYLASMSLLLLDQIGHYYYYSSSGTFASLESVDLKMGVALLCSKGDEFGFLLVSPEI